MLLKTSMGRKNKTRTFRFRFSLHEQMRRVKDKKMHSIVAQCRCCKRHHGSKRSCLLLHLHRIVRLPLFVRIESHRKKTDACGWPWMDTCTKHFILDEIDKERCWNHPSSCSCTSWMGSTHRTCTRKRSRGPTHDHSDEKFMQNQQTMRRIRNVPST